MKTAKKMANQTWILKFHPTKFKILWKTAEKKMCPHLKFTGTCQNMAAIVKVF